MANHALDDSLEVRCRLVRAADLLINDLGLDAATPAAIAEQAGVSRATAFRRLGKRSDMLHAVALHRARQLIPDCSEEMSSASCPLQQIRSGFRYLVAKLSDDEVISETLRSNGADLLDADARVMATMIFGATVSAGRSSGSIRTDVPFDIIVEWIVEQLYLALQQSHQAVNAAETRVSMFLWPAIATGS